MSEALVKLDLNNPVFQMSLFSVPKHVRHSAMETLSKLARMTWSQVYRDNGLKWEKIVGMTADDGRAVYSLRITQSLCATAYRDGDFMRLRSIPTDHDATYGKK